MLHFRKSLFSIIAVLAVSLTLLGCDSGGDDGGDGGGDSLGEVSLKVEGSAETDVQYFTTFYYDIGTETFCPEPTDIDSSPEKAPDFESVLNPNELLDEVTCPDSSPEDYVGVKVRITDTDNRDLTVKLLDGNGDELASTDEANEDDQYVVETGDVNDEES